MAVEIKMPIEDLNNAPVVHATKEPIMSSPLSKRRKARFAAPQQRALFGNRLAA